MVEIGPVCRQRLVETTITWDQPGSILRDLQRLAGRIGPEGIKTQSLRGNLPSAVLFELNTLLSQPIELHLTRALLQHYPNIAGLYILLRVLNLVRVEGSLIRVDPVLWATWLELNPAEQYFALMEACLFDAEEAVLGGPARRDEQIFARILHFLTRLRSNRWKSLPEYVHSDFPERDTIPAWIAQLMMRFGWIEGRPRSVMNREPYGTPRGWMLEAARRTPWGEAVVWAILEHLRINSEEESDVRFFHVPPREEPGVYQQLLQPFFPEYRRVFRPAEPVPRSGTYIFKVGFDQRTGARGVWRRLAVPAELTLHDLADAVLDAFDFYDHDHLHEFRYRDHTGRQRIYLHYGAGQEPSSEAISLDETGLPESGTMQFRFDFGDDWRFLLRLERIDSPDPKLDKPKLIESRGNAPRQYPEPPENW